jgi:hypothetical protein
LTVKRIFLSFLLAAGFLAGVLTVAAQGTAFLYQGRLNDGGGAATGKYDLRCALYDAVTNGNLASLTQTNLAVPVTNGLFTLTLDFGAVFTGTNYYLALDVRTNTSTGSFTTLWPRQPVLPVPYAVFATGASNLLGSLSVRQLAGTLTSTQLSGTYSSSVSFTNAANTFNGTFAGSGAALTSLNASAVSSGTLADARLTTNVALLNANQTFTGSNVFNGVNTFPNWTNSFTGSFFGNGLVGWIPVSGTSTQAVRDTGYLLLSSSLATVTLPTSANLMAGDIIRVSGAGIGGWRITQNAGQSINGIFYTASNASWLGANAVSAGWQALACSADGVKLVAAAGGGGGIYTSGDSGATWNSPGSSYSPIAVASTSDGTMLFGVVSAGGIIRSTNSGTSWQLVASTTKNWQSIACSTDGSKVVAVVNGEYIYASTNYGVTWYARNTSIGTKTWYACACTVDGSRMTAGIYGGNIYTSSDYGLTWNVQSGSPSTNWTSIACSQDGSRLVASAFYGRLYTSSDYGASWTAQTAAPTNTWYAVACSADCGRIIAAGYNSSVYISADSGNTWTKQPLSIQNWKAVACSNSGAKMTAGYAATSTTGALFYWIASQQGTATTVGTGGSLTGGQGTSIELQYIGGDLFMPISSAGVFWAN